MKLLAAILACMFATDASAQWTQVAAVPTDDIFNVWANGDTITAGSDSTAFVSVNGGATWIPTARVARNIFSVQGVRMKNGRLFAATNGAGVFVSDNLGATWQDFNQGLVGGFLNSQLRVTDLLLRADTLYVATGGSGAWRRILTPGGTWAKYGNALEPAQASNMEGLAASPTRLEAAAGGNGDVYWREPTTPDWTVSFLINNTVAAGLASLCPFWTGHSWLIGTNIGVFRSPSGQSPWVYTDFGLHPTFLASFAMRNGVVFTHIASGEGTGIEFSTDDGVTWQVLDAQPATLTYNIAISGSTMYAGRVDGLWQRPIGTVGVAPGPPATGLHFAIAGANPVGDEARFRFDLPGATRIRIGVFNVTGRRMPGSIDEERPAGANEVRWSARDLPPGMYFARLVAGEQTETARLVHAR